MSRPMASQECVAVLQRMHDNGGDYNLPTAATHRGALSMYSPYDKETASPTDRVAWALCQIIDDDAPMRWTRYRFAAECIALNPEVMADLEAVRDNRKPAGEQTP